MIWYGSHECNQSGGGGRDKALTIATLILAPLSMVIGQKLTMRLLTPWEINKEREELITEGEFNQIKEELFRSFILKLGELGDTKHNKQYWCDKLGK